MDGCKHFELRMADEGAPPRFPPIPRTDLCSQCSCGKLSLFKRSIEFFVWHWTTTTRPPVRATQAEYMGTGSRELQARPGHCECGEPPQHRGIWCNQWRLNPQVTIYRRRGEERETHISSAGMPGYIQPVSGGRVTTNNIHGNFRSSLSVAHLGKTTNRAWKEEEKARLKQQHQAMLGKGIPKPSKDVSGGGGHSL